MTDKLNELDKQVEEKEKELAQKLKDKQAIAIKAIDQKIEKMKESMSGALAKLGKLLLEAAKKFFTWALQKFGYSLSEIEGIINKGAAVLKAIFTKPIKFVKNLFNAADQGFSNFGKNFLTHLKNALFSWLTGSLTEVKLPDTWDLKGIASVALQMVGNLLGSIGEIAAPQTPKTIQPTAIKGSGLNHSKNKVSPTLSQTAYALWLFHYLPLQSNTHLWPALSDWQCRCGCHYSASALSLFHQPKADALRQ